MNLNLLKIIYIDEKIIIITQLINQLMLKNHTHFPNAINSNKKQIHQNVALSFFNNYEKEKMHIFFQEKFVYLLFGK